MISTTSWWKRTNLLIVIIDKDTSRRINIARKAKSLPLVTDVRWNMGWDVAKYRSKFITNKVNKEKARKMFVTFKATCGHVEFVSNSPVNHNNEITAKVELFVNRANTSKQDKTIIMK